MAQAHRKPNVIVCLCDQLRSFEVGCYGNSFIRTPNMDRLAERGVRFDIACSNNPVCTPGRSVLLSGQYCRTCMGSLVNVGEPVPQRIQLKDPTLADSFKAAGYDTALIGKWHIGPTPQTIGFDFAVYPYHAHRYTHQLFHRSYGEDITIEGFAADYETEELGKYISEHRENPFFMYYNISQPHMPVDDIPERYKTMYDRNAIPLRPNVFEDGKLAHDENWFRIYLYDYLYYGHKLPYTLEPLDGFDLRDLIARYDGNTTYADDQLGSLVRLLEENGIADDTIIVFTSDHGDVLGSHQLFNKDQLYEEAMRIPMIFHWPGTLAPRTITSQVSSLVDVAPTLLSLAGVEIPSSTQGTDLAAVTRGEIETTGENAAFIETSPGLAGVRTLTHLYGVKKERTKDFVTRGVIDDEHQFFDVVNDPFELDNLAKTGRDRALADTLKERVLKWDRETPWMKWT